MRGHVRVDYADRLNGVCYEDIAARGGGICDTPLHTRLASEDELYELNVKRLKQHLARGVTTVEIKSGYGLQQDELKQLRAIKRLSQAGLSRVVPSCLAAHVLPPEFKDASIAKHDEYLNVILNELLPMVQKEQLAQRVDAFVEPSAFPVNKARKYFKKAQQIGFDLCVHADQFRGGAELVVS